MGLPLTAGAASTTVGVAKVAGVWPALDVWLGEQINLSSTAALTGDGPSHYCASKAGVMGLTRSIARELAASGGILGFSLYPHHLKDGSDCTLPDFCQWEIRTQSSVQLLWVFLSSIFQLLPLLTKLKWK